MSSHTKARVRNLELPRRVLQLLADTDCGLGLTFGEIRAKFSDSMLPKVLDWLEEQGFVDRCEGLVFTLTPLGRSRLSE